MKVIYYYTTHECEFFFDDKYNLITWWALNDAKFRHEYMNPLIKHMGYSINSGERSKVYQTIQEELLKMGFLEDEIELDEN